MRAFAMRTFAVALFTALLTGCGVLGSSSLREADVAGSYAVDTYRLEPTAGLDATDFTRGRRLPDDLRLVFREGTVEALQGSGRVALASGSYTIRGREVQVRWDDLGPLADAQMPRQIEFDADRGRLRADVLLTDLDLEEISDEYDGISRGDARLRLDLRREM